MTGTPRHRLEAILGQHGRVVWFTGLSGSGKSTIARALGERLLAEGRPCIHLDADAIRAGLNRDLGFDAPARAENIRRIGILAAMFADAGLVAMASCMSPFRAGRDAIRAACPPGSFIEVHVSTPFAVCEARDVKGLYAKARSGSLRNLTGRDHPYEAPEQPEVVCDTVAQPVEACVAAVHAALARSGAWPSADGR